MTLRVFESERYVNQLVLIDPELVAAVDVGMARLKYRRVELRDLDPGLSECFASRDKTFQKSDFRPENDRLVYTGDGNFVQVRRYGVIESNYWTNKWGASIVHATSIHDSQGFNREDIDELAIQNNVLWAAIERKKADLPGVDFKAVSYPLENSPHPFDPSDELVHFSGGLLFTNQQLWIKRQQGADIVGVEREKVITLLATMLPYLTDVVTRFARTGATRVRALRTAQQEFEEVLSFESST
ncbi:MAG TPA: hypothetical protein VJA47_06105 [archaeon]|nr:hypothetical protein [archaeon]